MLTEEKALEIARMLKERHGEQGLWPTISHTVKVSGREIKKVARMIEKGLIMFNEEGKPYFVTPFKQIEKYYLGRTKDMEPEEIAEKTVQDTVEGAIAEEAATQSQQYIVLGKAVWQAFVNYAVKHGMTIDDIRKTPIHEKIIRDMEKADKLDEVQQENMELKRQLLYLLSETNPIIRTKNIIKKTTDILIVLTLLDEAGFNIEPLIPFYEKTIYGYLTGYVHA